jgi:hypothetical protein
MNTGQRNSQGRVIFRGPRGGEYVLGADGRKIRTFRRATAAVVSSALANAKAHMNTIKTMKARKAYLRSRAVNMSNANWKALGEYKNTLNYRARAAREARAAAPAAAPAVPAAALRAREKAAAALAKRLSKMLKLSNNEYINKYGIVYNGQAKMKIGLGYMVQNNAAVRAFNKDPKFLQKHLIPYVSNRRPNQEFMAKLKLKNTTILREGKTYEGRGTFVFKKVYFNKKGDLYYISLNGKKHKVDGTGTHGFYTIRNAKEVRRLKRLTGQVEPSYPRSAIPPATPLPAPARRSSPELLENMMNQIYNGGRGSNINAGRYTMEERNALARRLGGSIAYFKQHRNAKKAEAAEARQTLRNTGVTGVGAAVLRAKAAAANERVGYYDDAVRAYTRGLRAVKPLSGVVTPRARAMPNTPNRYTPAPANVTNNAVFANLTRPHLVVKTPGVGTIYLNPNSFAGYMKNASRVIIAPANVRNWLRMARRNFPNEPLFRHPLAPKNVTASHIRFSK